MQVCRKLDIMQQTSKTEDLTQDSQLGNGELSSGRTFWPEIVFVARGAEDDLITSKVLQRLRPEHVEYVDGDLDPLMAQNKDSSCRLEESALFSRGKRALMLKRHKGSWMRSCPGTSHHVCCNLWTVDPGEGCPLDCTYCYLQTYLRNNPTLKIFTNTDNMLEEMQQKFSSEPARLFRVCTGELVDSLVWDDLTDLSTDLVPFFARQQNAVLELKTKTGLVDNLEAMRSVHAGRTVISWSVNARTISDYDEAYTWSVADRLQAAARVVEAGYRVGFHFDPVVYFEGWQDEYRDLVRQIFGIIDPSRVAWISISTLRYQKAMQTIMQERFAGSRLMFGDQFLARDNKLRYVQPLRFALTSFVWNELKNISSTMPVYMCMESSAAWRNIAGKPPMAGSELAEVFARQKPDGGSLSGASRLQVIP